MSCTSCNCSLVQRYKLLRCLHPVCTQCVTRLIQPEDNSIKCPGCGGITQSPGLGRSHLSTLPSCLPVVVASDTSTAGAQGGVEPAICEHCTEETPATCVCLDCSLDLCSEHAVGHTKKRKTKGHRVVPAGDERGKCAGVSGKELESPCQTKCPVHLIFDITQFCKTCDDVVCSVCLDRGAHDEHRESLVSIQEAGRASRKEIEKNCKESGDTAVRLNEKLKELETVKAGIREQAVQLSKQITEEIGKKIAMLKQQVAKLLDNLDCLQWQKTLPLEKQSSELQQCLSVLSRLSDVSESCAGDYDIVRIAPWVKDKATGIVSRADEPADVPSTACQLACKDLTSIFTSEDIALVGVVFDQHDVDLEKSQVDFPAEVVPGQRFDVSVKLVNTSGADLGEESPVYKSLSLCFAASPASEGASAASAVSTAERTPHFSQVSPRVWQCRLDSRGTHLLNVKCASRHLQCSPCSILVLKPVEKFDPSFCQSPLQLSNDDMTVTCPGSTGQRSVYTTPVSSGVHHVHLKFKSNDKVHTGWSPICGIVDSGNTPQEGSYGEGGFIGVSSGSGTIDGHATQVGQAVVFPKWTAKEVDIFMCINCDERTLNFRLTQSDVTVETQWSGIPQSVRVNAGLFYDNTSFTIVPC